MVELSAPINGCSIWRLPGYLLLEQYLLEVQTRAWIFLVLFGVVLVLVTTFVLLHVCYKKKLTNNHNTSILAVVI